MKIGKYKVDAPTGTLQYHITENGNPNKVF